MGIILIMKYEFNITLYDFYKKNKVYAIKALHIPAIDIKNTLDTRIIENKLENIFYPYYKDAFKNKLKDKIAAVNVLTFGVIHVGFILPYLNLEYLSLYKIDKQSFLNLIEYDVNQIFEKD